MTSDSSLPFSFSLLPCDTSSKIENLETLDLISKLSAPLPLLKQAAVAADETNVEDMPEWVEKLAMDKGASSAWKVTEKEISASDISDQHNRLMIGNQAIQEKIKPMMNREEIEAANLTNIRRNCGGEGQSVGRKRGRIHEGLEVMVYNKSGSGCLLYLTRWDSIESTVLKGPNYKEFRRYFSPGEMIEMWAFRDGADKLCFVIENKST